MANRNGTKGIGIIGFGGFGEFLRRSWNEMDTVRVVAVCDSDPMRAPVDVKFYCQVAPMLADPNVDIVAIATPPNSHKDLAILALEADKAVLIEKPLALNEHDGLLVKEVADRNNRVAAVDFMMRFNPIVETLRQIVQSEVLGKIRRIDLRNYAMLDQTPENHWFWNPNISGRILLEHGVHFFDVARWVIDSKAADVVSMVAERKPGIEDRMFAAVKYENNVIGTFWHSFSRPRELERTSFHFAFDLGEIDVYGWIPLELKLWGWTNKRGAEIIESLDSLADFKADRMEQVKVQSSELLYDVEYNVNARVELNKPKMAVYADNVRSIMCDMVRAIDDPSHRVRVTLEDAIEAVRVAEMATRFAHSDMEEPGRRLGAEEVLKP